MPENPWGPDVAPHLLEEFDAAAGAGTWALKVSQGVSLDQAFAIAASPWTLTWGGSSPLLFDNWAAALPAPLRGLLDVGRGLVWTALPLLEVLR